MQTWPKSSGLIVEAKEQRKRFQLDELVEVEGCYATSGSLSSLITFRFRRGFLRLTMARIRCDSKLLVQFHHLLAETMDSN